MVSIDKADKTQELAAKNYELLLETFTREGLIGYFNFYDMFKVMSFGDDEMYIDEFDGHIKPFIASDRMQVVNEYEKSAKAFDILPKTKPYNRSDENNVYPDDTNEVSSSLIFSLFQFDKQCETVKLNARLLSFMAFDTFALTEANDDDTIVLSLFNPTVQSRRTSLPPHLLRMQRSLFIQHFARVILKTKSSLELYSVAISPKSVSQYLDFACIVYASRLNGYPLVQNLQAKLAFSTTEELFCYFVEHGWTPQFIFAVYLSQVDIASLEMMEALFTIYESTPYNWFHTCITELT